MARNDLSFLPEKMKIKQFEKLVCNLKNNEKYVLVIDFYQKTWLKSYTDMNTNSHNSLKLSFTNIQGLHSNFVECESFLESNSPNILALCETNLDESIDSGNFFEGLSSFNPKRFYYSYVWSCSSREGRTSFCTGLISRKLYRFVLMFLTSITSLNVLLLFPLLITFFVVMHSF